MKIFGKEYSFENLKNNFKDPKFVISIWQQICILAFLSGVVIGAVLTQNFYIEQVNSAFQQAIDQDGCFKNWYINAYKLDNNSPLWDMKDVFSVNIQEFNNNNTYGD